MNKGDFKPVSIYKEKGNDFKKLFTNSILNYLESNDYTLKDSTIKRYHSVGSYQIKDEKEKKNERS